MRERGGERECDETRKKNKNTAHAHDCENMIMIVIVKTHTVTKPRRFESISFETVYHFPTQFLAHANLPGSVGPMVHLFLPMSPFHHHLTTIPFHILLYPRVPQVGIPWWLDRRGMRTGC